MDIRTILVPVDFTACSGLVTRKAASLSVKLGARLILHHAAVLPSGLRPSAEVFQDGEPRTAEDWALQENRGRLEAFAAEARGLGAEVDVLSEAGAVVPTILAAAARVGADLIVMGTHGRSGLARLVLGSVAEGVSHQAHVPVMLIRREPRPECGRDACTWCSLDGQSDAERALGAEAQG